MRFFDRNSFFQAIGIRIPNRKHFWNGIYLVLQRAQPKTFFYSRLLIISIHDKLTLDKILKTGNDMQVIEPSNTTNRENMHESLRHGILTKQ